MLVLEAAADGVWCVCTCVHFVVADRHAVPLAEERERKEKGVKCAYVQGV